MIRTVTLPAGSSGVLVTDYADTYPQLTIFNLGNAIAYLGAGPSVAPRDGIPLYPGTATAWSGSSALYAAADATTTIMITDNVGLAQVTGAPPANNTWTWGKYTFPNPYPAAASSIDGITDGVALAAGTTQCALTVTVSDPNTQSIQLELDLISTVTGASTSLGYITINAPVTNQKQGIILQDVTIPFGGYTLALSAPQGPTINTAQAVLAATA